MHRTGGGPSNAPEFTIVEEKVMSLCSNIKGLEARHDSDTIPNVPITISDEVLEIREYLGEITPAPLSSAKSKDTKEHNDEAFTIDIPGSSVARPVFSEITLNIKKYMEEILIFDGNNNDHDSQKENKSDHESQKDNKSDHESQKEKKWNRWHPNALKSRVSKVLKQNISKSSVSSKLDKLSSARLELVELDI